MLVISIIYIVIWIILTKFLVGITQYLTPKSFTLVSIAALGWPVYLLMMIAAISFKFRRKDLTKFLYLLGCDKIVATVEKYWWKMKSFGKRGLR